MQVGITGATGFIGHHVEQALRARGDSVIRFSRHPKNVSVRQNGHLREDNFQSKRVSPAICNCVCKLTGTDPIAQPNLPASLQSSERIPKNQDRLFSTSTIPDVNGCDALIHLAGESIFGFWTKTKRKKILESRREGTRRIVEGVATASTRPKILICASAIGYYGDRGDEILEETSSKGSGFLEEVTSAWEEEARQAEKLGVRVVSLRFGLVLGKDGGFLKKALPFFRWGLGTELGNGRQWMSCIHIEDLVRLILWCFQEEKANGVFNAVMPTPIINHDFTKALAEAVHRPALLSVPAWILHLSLGDFSHLLLDSQRVIPKRALKAGFQFRYSTVEAALQGMLEAETEFHSSMSEFRAF